MSDAAVAGPSLPKRLLDVRSVRKSFGSNLVLDHISLSLDEHSCTALIGASGSGKSTLLRCIDLLDVVDDGVIEFRGRDITDPRVDANEVRTDIGIVFQAFNLFPHMRVLDNVTLALRRVHRVPRERAEHEAAEMLTRVGLRAKASARPDELSGGQQQRVAIARSLVLKPKLMLFDEVTSALDPELVGEVLGMIRELRDDGMAMLVATHEMGFAREVADRVCFLDAGRVLESGAPEQLFQAPHEERTRQFLARIIDAGRL